MIVEHRLPLDHPLRGRYGALSGDAVTAEKSELERLVRGESGAMRELAWRGVGPLDPPEVVDWLLGLGIDPVERARLLWNGREGIELSYEDFVTYHDDLWYPSSDDVWVVAADRRWVLELDHEEVFRLLVATPMADEWIGRMTSRRYPAIKVGLSSPPNREGLVADLMADNVRIAEVNQESGTLTVELYPRSDHHAWRLDHRELVDALEAAASRLER